MGVFGSKMKCGQYLLLIDTSGKNYYVAIRLPATTQPKSKKRLESNRKRARLWRQQHKKQHAANQKLWRKQNPIAYRAIIERSNNKQRQKRRQNNGT
jgi:hypothetical protein